MRNRARDPRTVRNEELFREQFSVLHRSAVGVTVIMTREPHRCVESLRRFTFGERELAFKAWSIVHGWVTYDRTDPEAMQADNQADPVVALRAINALGGSGQGFPDGIYVMVYPHPMIEKSHAMQMVIKEYSRLFAEHRARRLVLIVPDHFTLPAEIEHDVVVMDFNPPSYPELVAIYQAVSGDVPENIRPRFTEENVHHIVTVGAGMTAHEFSTAVSRALIEHRSDLPKVSIESFVGQIMAAKVEVVKKTGLLEVVEAQDMDQIGGLEVLKAWIRKRARCFSQGARDAGVDMPKGVLLAGPPGTGKSAAAKAIAKTLNLPLIRFDISRCFTHLVGASEGKIRSALKMLEAMAPCVPWIDELDKMFDTRGGGGDSGVGRRMLGTVLTWMSEQKAGVFTVATANDTGGIPPELMRKGRLDEVFAVTTPNPEGRRAILEIHLRKRGYDPAAVEGLDDAVTKSEGFVGSELEAAVKEAIVDHYADGVDLTGSLIASQLDHMVPLSQAFAEQFQAMELWARQNARSADGDPASPVPVRTRTRASHRVAAAGGQRGLSLDG